MEVDEDIRDTLRRLLDEAIDGRKTLEAKFDNHTDRILTVLDNHSKELRDLRQEYHSLNAAVYRLEARFDRLSSESRDDVTDIRRHLSEIDARLRSLEERRDHDA